MRMGAATGSDGAQEITRREAREEAWRAVANRDGGYAGVFIYGVVTTGIYCRPGCPSRLPRPENVRFFVSPSGAESAGFRACRRCRPDDPGSVPAARMASRAMRYLRASAGEKVTLPQLARALHVSPHHLQRTFTRVVGVSPHAYHAALRGELLRSALREESTATLAGFRAGYESSSQMYRDGTDRLGMTPGQYARGGAGLEVVCTTLQTELGHLLVGTTPNGVCLVLLGDSAAHVELLAREELPEADLSVHPWEDSPWLREIVASVETGAPLSRNLPLDLRGSPFRLRVWEALRRIPAGTTLSYAEVAVAIGSPGAARAVASACADNRLAVVIPCHRVVRGDGGYGGYRWGVERKRELLRRERAAHDAGEVERRAGSEK